MKASHFILPQKQLFFNNLEGKSRKPPRKRKLVQNPPIDKAVCDAQGPSDRFGRSAVRLLLIEVVVPIPDLKTERAWLSNALIGQDKK